MRIDAEVSVAAPREQVWAELTDWEGQGRWIPATTVTVRSERRAGVGTVVRAFSGLQFGPLPLGLIDNFVVTGWVEGHEIEVLHRGPVFTGPAVFRLDDGPDGTTHFRVIEDAQLPVPGLDRLARLIMPLLRFGLAFSMRRLARIVESGSPTASVGSGSG